MLFRSLSPDSAAHAVGGWKTSEPSTQTLLSSQKLCQILAAFETAAGSIWGSTCSCMSRGWVVVCVWLGSCGRRHGGRERDTCVSVRRQAPTPCSYACCTLLLWILFHHLWVKAIVSLALKSRVLPAHSPFCGYPSDS